MNNNNNSEKQQSISDHDDEDLTELLNLNVRHVTGACRVDERLKPLLKVNASSSVAEHRLLSHLTQHFEVWEVGLLARYLCIPLVSVRVGKVNKQGTLLVPTTTRGNLVLALLPNSDLHLSFLADDGSSERLSILRNVSDCSSVVIEGILADSSGRSFAVRIANRDPFYFWCSERSSLLGNELLTKMKDLLKRNPSLAELTGISDSRLECFVHHLRTYLIGSNIAAEVGQSSQSSFVASKPSRARSCSIQGVLSPRPSSFKLRRRSEVGRVSPAESPEKHPVSYITTGESSTTNCHEQYSLPESSPETCLFPSVDIQSIRSRPQIPRTIPSSLFSPYYCWCPPSRMIPASTPESYTLPPLSSLLAASASSPNLSETPFLPLSMSESQWIPIFNPLMCDPIVHIPVTDICSSGQAFLVSGGPGMSISIPPLHNPLVQDTESEKSARDTLRLLITGSSQFPSILVNTDGGSRDFYGAATDVNAIANSFAAMSLVSPGVMSCIDQGDPINMLKEPVETGGKCLNEDNGLNEGSGE
ncbi:hypothetical protein CTI12_AA103460 [Artemisia annua]|uniref:Uncharacterized protein n=1 Tax=Artemisia annua TaxID=35608 RepID=A0A2U1PWL1_ARTAN|nr:hypothetical protein CTI12_AA103460 [Artemisia annua]